MRLGFTLLSTATLAAALTAVSPEARACGGCFAPPPPPGEQQSVVTDHRMILSVSQQQTTLYDQIQYQGDPKSFAWVLPIAGTVTVGLSADTLFSTIHNLTATAVQSPPLNCPAPPSGCASFGGAEDSAGSAPSAASDAGAPTPGVDVNKREVVGPYETVQLHSTDANALTAWLTQNGYAIPDDIKPVISAYVSEHFDFLAIRLQPGKGVTAMRPVRVTTSGASIALPLRMVAAGSGATVGITLWVVGEGRYEPQNFPSFVIKNEDLTWDWKTGTSDYKSIRAAREAAQRNAWEIESSQNVSTSEVEQAVRGLSTMPGPNGTGSDYAPVTDANGTVTQTADTVREADFKALFEGISEVAGSGEARITRMRADLGHAALTADLVMTASADQSALANVRVPTHELSQPQCPVYQGCQQVGTAPRDQAIAQSSGGGHEAFSCKASGGSKSSSGLGALGGVAAFLGLAFVRARRANAKKGV